MKFLDRFLRDWRIRKAIPYIKTNAAVLDIGCLDGHLFKKLSQKPIGQSLGLDPLLKDKITMDNYTLIPGMFPENLSNTERFDSITMLAVLEHIPREEQLKLNDAFYKHLKPLGRVIITVPSPFVDQILWVLSQLRLIDGMSLEEHYGFKVEDVPELFDTEQFKCVTHRKFQLGLNNLFVFEKVK